VSGAQDTSPDIQARVDEAYRRMTDQQKFERAMGLSATLRALTLDHLRELHPSETERQLEIRLLLRTVSADVVGQAFGWLPPAAGPAAGRAGAIMACGSTLVGDCSDQVIR